MNRDFEQLFRSMTEAANEQRSEARKKEASEALQTLRTLPGMEAIKDQVEQMIQLVSVAKKRSMHGLKSSSQSLHMLFTGNPGTGKTTAARLIGQAFAEMGLLKTKNPSNIPFVEIHHNEIESPMVGVAEERMADAFENARGGVMFIDEAYSFLGRAHHKSNEKVIAVIVQKMEDLRDEVLVIAAGYPDEMEDFLNYNPGLRSRFSNVIHFPDYDTADMLRIAELLCDERDYRMSRGFKSKLSDRLEKESKLQGFGNARTVRNIIEQSIRRQSIRVSQYGEMGRSELMALIEDDLDTHVKSPKSSEKENPFEMMQKIMDMMTKSRSEQEVLQ